MRVTGSVCFLRVIERDSSALVFHGSSREAAEHYLFFEGAVRGLFFKDFSMLVLVTVIFKTKKSIKAGLKLFSQLGSRNSHLSALLKCPSNRQWFENQTAESAN